MFITKNLQTLNSCFLILDSIVYENIGTIEDEYISMKNYFTRIRKEPCKCDSPPV